MSIETKVRKIVAEKLKNIDIEDVIPEASFENDLGANSLDMFELFMTMEEVFEIDTDDDDAARSIVTVQDAIDYVKSKL
ncbi:MAG: acyl carrier protein [Desulfamplus sp.]|nr:acyl carrier protein [Desulfamplus sp.]